MDNNIGNKIRYLREERGITQKQLAENISSTNKNIWAYETGYTLPPVDTIIRLSKFFGVSVDYLLGLEDDFGGKVAGSNSPRSTLSGVPAAPELSNEEKKLIKFYRAIGETARVAIYTTAESFFNQLPEEKKVIFR